MKLSDPKKLSSNGIRNIIFDWGGVITNLDFDIVKSSFQKLGIDDFVQLFSKAYQNKFLTDFEINKVSPEQFRSEIRKLSKQDLSDESIDMAWNSVLRDTPLARIELLQQLKTNYRTFLLSNTNIIHATYYNQKLKSELDVNHSLLFEEVYYSHDIGIRKPDAGIFEHVLNASNLNPTETLFIDDMEANADVAASLGMKAFYLNLDKFDLTDVFKYW